MCCCFGSWVEFGLCPAGVGTGIADVGLDPGDPDPIPEVGAWAVLAVFLVADPSDTGPC